jgi:hypothetical protein
MQKAKQLLNDFIILAENKYATYMSQNMPEMWRLKNVLQTNQRAFITKHFTAYNKWRKQEAINKES